MTDTFSVELDHADAPRAEYLSIVALLHTPNVHQGKLIRVVGFASLGFEGNGLFLSAVDLDNGISKNALWLEIQPHVYDALDRSYVLVEGTFDGHNKGHLQMWSGSVVNVALIESWAALVDQPRARSGA